MVLREKLGLESKDHEHIWVYRSTLWRCMDCPANHLMLSPACGGWVDLGDEETMKITNGRFSGRPLPPPLVRDMDWYCRRWDL